MLIIQGEKTKCALHRGGGTKELETWLVSSELSKKVVAQSSQPNCVAQDSQECGILGVCVFRQGSTALTIYRPSDADCQVF
jgi:hypothetical protein